MSELHLKYRPQLLKEVIGQDDAVEVIKGYLRNGGIPHTVLLSGPAGTGKTSIARILANKVNAGDIHDVNAASSRGIDMVREIQKRNFPPLSGMEVYILDESHALTGDAQDALLKTIEEPKKWLYFFLCSTLPQKLKETIRSRCAKIQLKPVKAEVIGKHLKDVCGWEDKPTPPQTVIDRILEVAGGCVREALVQLGAVINLATEEKQLAAIQEPEVKRQAIELCRLLMKPKVQWGELSLLLQGIKEDAEQVRRAVLGYANSVLIGKDGKPGQANRQAYEIIEAFRDNYYEMGAAGLSASCFRLFGEARK